MKNGLSELPGVRVVEPEGAFYIFADITGTGMTDTEFADGALESRCAVDTCLADNRRRGLHQSILCN